MHLISPENLSLVVFLFCFRTDIQKKEQYLATYCMLNAVT